MKPSMRWRDVWFVFWGLCGWIPAHALFASHETQQVPIDRLVTNLERSLAQNTNDARTLYYLARLYSMRGASFSNSVEVIDQTTEPQFGYPGSDAGVPQETNALADPARRAQSRVYFTNAIRYYDRALEQIPQSTNRQDQWLILPARLGYAWTLEQVGRTNDALREYRRTLDEAWAREMTISFRDWVEHLRYSWDARQWSGLPQPGLGPGVCFSEETIGYLLHCLDPVADAAEIAELKERQARLARAPRAVTPVLLPMSAERDLRRLIHPEANVSFDLDGTGQRRRWGWIRDTAAWLVWDPEGNGQMTSGLQLVGSVTFWVFWRDGYEVLTALDDNGDGRLSGGELDGLALWRDADSNGVSEPGEVIPVARAGLRELRCRPEIHPTGIPYHPEGADFGEPFARPTFDWSPAGRPDAGVSGASVLR